MRGVAQQSSSSRQLRRLLKRDQLFRKMGTSRRCSETSTCGPSSAAMLFGRRACRDETRSDFYVRSNCARNRLSFSRASRPFADPRTVLPSFLLTFRSTGGKWKGEERATSNNTFLSRISYGASGIATATVCIYLFQRSPYLELAVLGNQRKFQWF